ncbi:hypothetical protein [Chryseobacterium scophthalmum]|uniref:hypothetical protein n=1 Tax=Chryseobacterium scophthalmum TaxID=59733 RepID=UPI003D020972
MKKLLFFFTIFIVQIFYSQLKIDSTIMFSAKNSLIYSSYNNACYGSGDYDNKYREGNMLFLTDVFQCNSYSSTKNILEFYFDGKKYYMEDRDSYNIFFLQGNKQITLEDIKIKLKNYSQSERDSINIWAKKFSEVLMRKLKTDAFNTLNSKKKYGIAILKANPTEEYSFTGAKFKILNYSSKTIKYITFNFYGKNAVNDKVGATLSRKGIGPVKSMETGSWEFETVWLTDIIDSMKLISVNIIYMDGTSKAIPITDNHWLDQDDIDNFDSLYQD